MYPFVRSLRESGTSADCVLFINTRDQDLIPLFATYRITAVPFDVADLPAFAKTFHPSSYRWILIQQYLESLRQPYLWVFFVDVRDTVFQHDPFQHVAASPPGLYAFREAGSLHIDDCTWNSGWVRACFGDAGLARVGGNFISCSGTTMAAWANAVQYAALLTATLADNPSCERNGVDQGMHNYFLYTNQLADSHVVLNEVGWVATVQSMPVVKRSRDGQVVNNLGQPVAVVHQWDRNLMLVKTYRRMYSMNSTGDVDQQTLNRVLRRSMIDDG